MNDQDFESFHEQFLNGNNTTCHRDNTAIVAGRMLLALSQYHRLSAHAVKEVWQVAGANAFAVNAAPSSICSDGTPLEISVTLSSKPSGLRYLTELGQGKKGWDRLTNSRKKLPQFLEILDLPPEPLLSLVDELIPELPTQFPPLRFGMWVSPVLSLTSNQLKVYINTGWRRTDDVWHKVFRLLKLAAWYGAEQRLRSLLPELERFHRLSFVGLENTIDGPERIKLYFRGTALDREQMVRIASKTGDSSEVLARLWEAILGDREIEPESAVLSISVPRDDQPFRVKVDVSTKQLGLPDYELQSLIETFAHAETLNPADYLATLKVIAEVGGIPAQHTLIGISTPEDRPRLNIYLKPGMRM